MATWTGDPFFQGFRGGGPAFDLVIQGEGWPSRRYCRYGFGAAARSRWS